MIYRYARRSACGLIIYVALNVALLIAEPIWHPIGRLTAWDVAQVQAILPASWCGNGHAARASLVRAKSPAQ